MRSIYPVACILVVIALIMPGGVALAAESKDGHITIGVLENKGYAFAKMMKDSFNLAKDKINAAGGVKGRPIKLVFADAGGDKETGVQAVRSLVKEKNVAMLVGGYSSSNTLQMARAADRMGKPFLVCTAADDRITQRKFINVFRLNQPAKEYSNGLESLLIHVVKPKSMAIIYENSPYGTGGAMRMMWFCRENEIEITAIIPYHKERAGKKYFKRLAAPLKNNTPEVVYMVSYLKDAVALVKHIRSEKINSLFFGGAGGFTHPKFIEKAGDSAQYLMTATLWTPDQQDPLAKEYASQYREKHHHMPDYHGAEAYSALLVAADALNRSKSLKPEDIRDALNKTELKTAFGKVAFKSYGKYERQNLQPTLVLQAINGQYKCVWPKEVSVAKYMIP